MARSSARIYPFAKSSSRRRRAAAVKQQPDLAALFDIGPFDRNQLTLRQIDALRNRIDSEGLPKVCAELGISDVTLLRVCAGFGHRLTSRCAAKVRSYFGD